MGDAIGPFRDNLTKIVVQLGKFFVDLYRIKTNVFLASPSALSILSFAYDNLVAATQNSKMKKDGYYIPNATLLCRVHGDSRRPPDTFRVLAATVCQKTHRHFER